ncbi:hypothetical protein ACQUW5_00610 [Legionella sp. CNM-1927-20]|uniref:hypothetical protein n=1 Tax=Legionella sp. CNM-1927-20 TaxID=3422221 RepID=UPI00403B1130
MMPREPNSLIAAWNPDKQAAYEFIKKISVQAVSNQIVKGENFKDLYIFLAGLRKKIAELLDQQDKNDLGKLREPKTTSNTMKTIIDNSGRYASFYNEILVLFEKMKEKCTLETGVNSLGFYGISGIKKINSVNYLTVMYGGINYSTLNLIHAQDKNDEDVSYIRIDHTNVRELEKMYTAVSGIYNELLEKK